MYHFILVCINVLGAFHATAIYYDQGLNGEATWAPASKTVHEYRRIRDISTSSGHSEQTKATTENQFAGRNNDSDFFWLDDALKDIAYYLRAHKFNEYDRRYQAHAGLAPREYFGTFPRPPLRSLHWEVHKFCEPSFLTCVEYLMRRIKNTGLKRADDTTIVIQEQQWNKSQHSKQIDAVERECRKMLKADDTIADPFQGPLERFQWRTTASYYMCWYTMNEVPDLKRLKESCDNFANCLDPNFGVHNLDPRAKDDLPYSCALYSFCPDPCCSSKHLSSPEECWESMGNPCFADNSVGQRECAVNRSRNTDFSDIVLNRWNVTCRCPHLGFEWDSKYGMCVDVDECSGGLHRCDPERGACVNLPGSFRCACRWGFAWNSARSLCEPSPALEIIKKHNAKPSSEKKDKKASSLVKRLFSKMFGRNECNQNAQSLLFVPLSGLIAGCIEFWQTR